MPYAKIDYERIVSRANQLVDFLRHYNPQSANAFPFSDGVTHASIFVYEMLKNGAAPEDIRSLTELNPSSVPVAAHVLEKAVELAVEEHIRAGRPTNFVTF